MTNDKQMDPLLMHSNNFMKTNLKSINVQKTLKGCRKCQQNYKLVPID